MKPPYKATRDALVETCDDIARIVGVDVAAKNGEALIAAVQKLKDENAALRDLVGEEWYTEMAGGDWHYLTCLTCGASHANITESSPNAKHRADCKRAKFFHDAKEGK